MQAGVLSILLAICVGVPTGLVAGYYRRAIDQVIMRLTDAWLSFPFLILAIGLVTILGPSLTNATVAIGMAATPTYIRLTPRARVVDRAGRLCPERAGRSAVATHG